jgi:hypothetical protein
MNICRFCKKECSKKSTPKEEYYVCEECKTVCFSPKANNCNIPQEILDYLNNVQAQIKAINTHGFLHKIEQKSLNGEMLPQEEQDLCDALDKFHELDKGLRHILKNGISLDDKNARNQLYELLDLSDKLEHALSAAKESKQN